MSVLIDKHTRLIVQGLTGREGTFHAKQAAAYGTTVVGGVTPGKGGTTHEGWPIFDTVRDAVENDWSTVEAQCRAESEKADASGERLRSLAAEIARVHPGLPVILMSGYTDPARPASSPLAAFIQQPFTVPTLLAAVRLVLARE